MIKKKIKLDIILENDPDGQKNIDGRIYYPNEGGKIHIKKYGNRLIFNEIFFHEVAHLFDWLLGNGSIKKNKEDKYINEEFALEVGLEMEKHFNNINNK